MDNKVVAIVAIAIVAIVAIGGAVALMGGDPDDPSPTPTPTPTPSDKDMVTYHGNGGLTSSSLDIFTQKNTAVASCMFTYTDHAFYKWNTKADGTGDMYTPNSTDDAAKLKANGVKDLYAYWGYSFSAAATNPGLANLVLVNMDSLIATLPIAGTDLPLDVNNNVCRIGLLIAGASWTYSNADMTVTATTADKIYTIRFSDLSGATNFHYVNDQGDLAAVAFNYTGPVSMSIVVHESTAKYSYYGNGGVYVNSDGKKFTEFHTEMTSVVVAQPFVKEGSTFDVWSENADGTGQTFTADKAGMEKFEASGLKALYAQWK